MTALTEEHTFPSDGLDCSGTLYLPSGVDRPPVVVMAHGLGGLKDFRLGGFAERFVERGLAVFTFDYRHWGESAGEPRQLLIPSKQLQDWRAAIAYVRTRNDVDSDRIGLWGSSFAGAHVIFVAAQDHAIKAVVSQVLAADTASAVKGFGMSYLLKSTVLGVVDALRGLLGMAPVYFPLVGRPGESAVMNTAECWDGYMGLVSAGARWENKVTARSLLYIPLYRAIKVADKVRAPTLLMGAVHDSLVPIEDIRALARCLPGAVLREYDCNHFEPYYPPVFESFATEQADFLVAQLGSGRPG